MSTNIARMDADAGTGMEKSPKDPTVALFWSFLAFHVGLWTLVPMLTQPNAPLDTMEMLFWGREMELGYYKHPPLPAWLAEMATWVAGNRVWPTYLLSQICVATCLWAAWRFARDVLSPWLALSAAALLDACYYYNYTTPEFNHNVTLRPLWALTTLFLFWAASTGKKRYWIAFGVAAAAGMYAKYQLFLLLPPMLLFSVWNPRARRCWTTAGPYLAILLFLVLLTPHLWWAWQHDFPAIGYALERTRGEATWSEHLVNPMKFLGAQMLAVAPAVVVALLLTGKRFKPRTLDEGRRFARDFLLAAVLGPLALILAISVLKGAHVRSMLGAPLFTLGGVLLLLAMEARDTVRINRQVAGRCAAISVVLAAALSVANVAGPYVSGKPRRIHFPGEPLARELQQRWQRSHAKDRKEIPVVGGPWWVAANAAFHLPGRPPVYCDLDPSKSPWLDDRELLAKGGVLVWDAEQALDADDLRKRFPNVHLEPPITLPYATGADLKRLTVGVAVIDPPAPSNSAVLWRMLIRSPATRPFRSFSSGR